MNLKRKIIGITIFMIFITTAVFGYFMKTAVYQTLEEEIDGRAIAIGKHFTELSADAYLSGSTSLLQTHLADYIKTENYLAYIIIFDSDGQIQAHTFPKAIPPEILAAVKNSTKEQSVHIFRRSDGIELEDFFIKSGTSRDGGVHIGIYESKIVDSINRLVVKLMPFLVGVILGGILIAYLLASAITSPLQLLSDGVKRVTHGDLDFIINVRTQDEIGQLAESFNNMTEKLRESTVSREFMEKLVNTMNDVLLVISPNGTVMNYNKAYSDLFGAISTGVNGKNADTFDSSEAPAVMYAAYKKSLEYGLVHGIESQCRSLSGNEIPLLLSLAVMKNEDGSPQAVICAAQNITNLKKSQDELQAKQTELEYVNKNLEEAVASRTAELAIGNEGLRAEVAERQKKTEELRAARDLAESASRAKSEFLANMSHEMRTPLNSIIGGTEYLESTQLEEEQRRCIGMIQHSGDSLLLLINDLIDLSRIEAGQLEILKRPFSLINTLERVIEMVSQSADRKKINLSLDCDARMPDVVIGDQARLQQILVNLVANAIKFTEAEGSVKVSTSCEPAVNELLPVTFAIKDTGIGIDPDKLDMIFDSFSQADTSITRRFGGSGLGLAISRKLVESMNGTFKVESVPGIGSTFSFTVKFSTITVESELTGKISKNRDKNKPERDVVSQAGAIRRVLLVDDSSENQALMRLLLKSLPLEIQEANNGQEALDMYTSTPFDLVLMDIQMPVMDGYVATKMIRRHEERAGLEKTCIIALTAHAYESDIQKCLDAGCDDHIAKPFKKQMLLDCLSRHF
jgi:PAS domain S-box-containing protein